MYEEHESLMGKVDFGGVFKRVCLAHTPRAQIGQYVIVHVGFALEVIDEAEAAQLFTFLDRMNELGELEHGEDLETGEDSETGEDLATVQQPD
jgi:hydrogenase expression/formation protein HypC